MIQNNRIYLTIPYAKKDLAKTIIGYRWHSETKEWSWPATMKDIVCDCFPWVRAQLEKEYELYARDKKIIDVVVSRAIVTEETFDLKKELENTIIPSDFIFKLSPYLHQITLLKCGLKWDKWAFFCDMGVGKTKVIIDLVQLRRQRTLVFCPKSVMYTWGKEVEINSDLSYTIASGNKQQKIKALLSPVHIVITNFETVIGVGNRSDIWNSFNMVILDESSKIKNHKAKRTKLLTKYFEKTPYKYILTGTPISQENYDIYSQFRFLDINFLGNKSFYSFRNTYCVMGGYMNYKVVGNKNKKQLIEKIARHSIQLAKEDCIELPEKIYEKRILEMNKELSGQYESMRKNLMLEISEDESITAPIVLTKLLRLQQILSGQYLKAENEKLDTLWEIIEEVLQNKEKIIVWARFRASIDLIINLLEKKKVKYSLIHGDIKDRQTEIDKFQEGNVPVFIGQIRTGGMGITLTAGNTIIYYENTFSLEDRKQSEDRAHRIGQKKKCLYIDLVYKDTIDEGILEVIEKKQDIAHCLVNNFKKGEYGLD